MPKKSSKSFWSRSRSAALKVGRVVSVVSTSIVSKSADRVTRSSALPRGHCCISGSSSRALYCSGGRSCTRSPSGKLLACVSSSAVSGDPFLECDMREVEEHQFAKLILKGQGDLRQTSVAILNIDTDVTHERRFGGGQALNHPKPCYVKNVTTKPLNAVQRCAHSDTSAVTRASRSSLRSRVARAVPRWRFRRHPFSNPATRFLVQI